MQHTGNNSNETNRGDNQQWRETDEARLVRAILMTGEFQVAHDRCQPRIAYAAEQSLQGVDLQAVEPEFVAHLADCEECRAEFDGLLAILRSEEAGELPTPPAPPASAWARVARALEQQPLVSQESSDAISHAPALWQTVQNGMRTLTERITLKIEAGRLVIDELPALLMPYYQLRPIPAALRTRSSDASDTQSGQLIFPLEEGLQVQFVPGAITDGLGTLWAQVAEVADGTPRAQVRMTLLDEQANLLERVYTNVDGSVIFQELAAGNYLVHVEIGKGYRCAVTLP